jgi:diguanylate cyclase (GGDEF)-like protein
MDTQKKNKLKTQSSLTRLLALTIFLALAAGVEWLHHEYQAQELSALRRMDALYAQATRARIEGELKAATAPAQGLANYLEARGAFANAEEIQRILAAFHRGERHVRTLGIVIGDRLTYLYPQRESEVASGLDYSGAGALGSALRRAKETRATALAGPLELAPGIAGFICLTPVFAGGEYWGLALASVETRSLFAAIDLDRPQTEREWALRVRGMSAAFLGEGRLFDDAGAATEEIDVPGGRWRLAVKNVAEANGGYWLPALRLLGWLLSALFAWQAFSSMKLLRRMSELALFDSLTGLPARPLFFDRLKQMIRRTKRNRGHFSVLFIDLDAFEKINRQYGRNAGDMMLAGIGKRLMNAIRHYDTVTRWGGDEFVVLLDDCAYDQALVITETLRHKIHLPVSYGERLLRVGASVGVATYPEDGHSLSALLKVADARLAEDKSRRRTESKPAAKDEDAAKTP